MHDIAKWLTDLWPIASTVTPLVLLGGFLWLKTQFATAPDFANLSRDLEVLHRKFSQHEIRFEQLASDIESSPTRLDMMRQMHAISERLGRVESNAEAARHQMVAAAQATDRQLATVNNYLHTLVEKGLDR